MKRWKVVTLIVFTVVVLMWTFLSNYKGGYVLSSFNDRTAFGRFLPNFNKIMRKDNFAGLVEKTVQKQGTYAIYIKNLSNNDVYEHNPTERFYAASLYKTPMAAAVFNMSQTGELSLEDKIIYTSIDFANGTGSIYTYPQGSEFSVDFVLDRLLKDSDNIAQNMLTRYYSIDKLKEGFDLITTGNKFFEDNTSSVLHQAELYEAIVESEYLTPTNKEKLLNKMSQTAFDDRIHKGLSSEVKFSHKIGNWGETGSWHDCGVASKDHKKIIVCVMSRHTSYDDFLFVTEKVGSFVNTLF